MRSLILLLLLGAGIWASTNALAEEAIFPKSMEFSIQRGIGSGSFDVQFTDARGANQYVIALRNFGGFGMTSDQQLWSYLDKKSLSLVGHKLTEGESTSNWLREVRLEPDCDSALGQGKTRCFKYREKGSGVPVQTEIFAPYPAIDLVSSLVVATRAAASGSSKQAFYNFIFNRATKQVSLDHVGEETLKTPLGKRKVKVLALTLVNSSTELYRFYIGHDERGHYPTKIVFTEGDQKTTELIASSVVW